MTYACTIFSKQIENVHSQVLSTLWFFSNLRGKILPLKPEMRAKWDVTINYVETPKKTSKKPLNSLFSQISKKTMWNDVKTYHEI